MFSVSVFELKHKRCAAPPGRSERQENSYPATRTFGDLSCGFVDDNGIWIAVAGIWTKTSQVRFRNTLPRTDPGMPTACRTSAEASLGSTSSVACLAGGQKTFKSELKLKQSLVPGWVNLIRRNPLREPVSSIECGDGV